MDGANESKRQPPPTPPPVSGEETETNPTQCESLFGADRIKSIFFSASLPKIGEGSGGVDLQAQLPWRNVDIELDPK